MDITKFFSLHHCLIHLLILIVSVGIIYLFYARKSSAGTKFPPGNKGLPIIGETLAFALAFKKGTPEKFFTDRTTKYSPDVFRSSLFGENMAMLCGASGIKFLFSAENKYVTSWWPLSAIKCLMHPSTVETYNFSEEANKYRSFLHLFLKSEFLQKYINLMDIMAREHLQKEWSPYKQVKVFPLTKKYTFTLVCRFFISDADADQIARLYEPFALLAAGLIALPINLPGTAFNRAMRAGKRAREELSAIILKRKIEVENRKATDATDLLSSMVLDGMSEIEITNKIMGFFVASYETSSSVITFIISYLADYPDVYRKVFQEQTEILKSKQPGELLNWDDINRMKYTWCVACEVMRLRPPANGSFREVTNDFTYAGYTIPKGWKVTWNVNTTHKDPKYFPDPEKFDPSRFEGNGPPPFTFVPFGGGPRMCPGREFARLQILVFIHNVVTRFEWEKLCPNEKIKYVLSPNPAEGLPVSLRTLAT